jgi:histidyl-tRNA synthetase
VTIDKNIVRGLDYYTSTVFEVTSPTLGAQDAIAAGGRYNNLMKELGGPQQGAIGFALGMERLIICLEDVLKETLPSILSSSIYVAYSHDKYIDAVKAMVTELENLGYATYSDLDNRSLKSQMKRANKFGFRWVLILNDGEYEQGNCTLKDLCASNEGQYLITLSDLGKRIGDKLGGK